MPGRRSMFIVPVEKREAISRLYLARKASIQSYIR